MKTIISNYQAFVNDIADSKRVEHIQTKLQTAEVREGDLNYKWITVPVCPNSNDKKECFFKLISEENDVRNVLYHGIA